MIVKTDASEHVLVAILSTQVNRNIHPVAFYSHTFNTTESNYNIYNKELLYKGDWTQDSRRILRD